jgi:excinuclease ABC subunit B
LIGVNLLREGSGFTRSFIVVAILDADKEGMLRSRRSMIQTVGRAARNINGKPLCMPIRSQNLCRQRLDETEYRRAKQMQYNEEHGLVPKALIKKSLKICGKKQRFP